MLDMGINVLLCVMLTGSAWIDIRRKQISLLWIILFAVLGVLVNVILHRNTLWSALGGICIGAFLIGISRITRGAIGLGDGCIVCVTGVYLGFYKNMQLLLPNILVLRQDTKT